MKNKYFHLAMAAFAAIMGLNSGQTLAQQAIPECRVVAAHQGATIYIYATDMTQENQRCKAQGNEFFYSEKQVEGIMGSFDPFLQDTAAAGGSNV